MLFKIIIVILHKTSQYFIGPLVRFYIKPHMFVKLTDILTTSERLPVTFVITFYVVAILDQSVSIYGLFYF